MKKLTLILFLLSVFLFSCKKDTTYLTQGQLMALRMEKDLGLYPNKTSSFSSIFVFNQSNSTVISSAGTSVRITNDGFIVISGTNLDAITFNLEQLKSYQLVPTGNLNLYF
jgi:hypothetical protein